MLSADVKDVAAVLADFRVQRGPRATARALLVAAWHPEEAPDEEDGYQHKHDDDRDRHPKLASVGLTPGMNGTIAARTGRVARGMPIVAEAISRFAPRPRRRTPVLDVAIGRV
jgi:hypothetical protein